MFDSSRVGRVGRMGDQAGLIQSAGSLKLTDTVSALEGLTVWCGRDRHMNSKYDRVDNFMEVCVLCASKRAKKLVTILPRVPATL